MPLGTGAPLYLLETPMTELPSPGPANGAYALGKAMNTVLMQVRVHQSISPQAPMGYSELITFLRACTKELEG